MHVNTKLAVLQLPVCACTMHLKNDGLHEHTGKCRGNKSSSNNNNSNISNSNNNNNNSTAATTTTNSYVCMLFIFRLQYVVS